MDLPAGLWGKAWSRPSTAFRCLAATVLTAWVALTIRAVSGGVTSTDAMMSRFVILATGYLALAAGVLNRVHRPRNRLGLLLVWFALALAAEDLQTLTPPLAHAVGLGLATATGGIAAHVVLAYPTGRLATRIDRIGVAICYLLAPGLGLLLIPGIGSSTGNVLAASPLLSPGVAPWVTYPEVVGSFATAHLRSGIGVGVVDMAGDAVGAFGLVRLLARYRRLDRPGRRQIGPVFLASGVAAACSALRPYAPDPLWLPSWWPATSVEQTLTLCYRLAAMAVPLLMLLEVIRAEWPSSSVRLLRDGAACATPAALQAALREHLGAPSLRLLLLRTDGVAVDVHDEPTDLAALVTSDGGAPGLHLTPVEESGQPVAWLAHPATLLGDGAAMAAATATVTSTLARWRIEAQVQRQAEAFRRVNEKAADTQAALERDLHDAVQARLVAALVWVRQAAGDVAVTASTGRTTEADPVRTHLDAATSSLQEALGDVRRLSRGLRAPLVRDGDLGAALREFAGQSAVPVDLALPPALTWPDEVAEATYRIVVEGVTNAVKHSPATRVRVRLGTESGEACVDVVDDGGGGARCVAAGGLAALRDRVALLGGEFAIADDGSGSRLTARIPLCGR